ncbi:hypothetical protein TNCV_4753581 [Trichonephila clavipes]|nr:hypothetical protein TNCV_4753581 [Trichonephila clavipes]
MGRTYVLKNSGGRSPLTDGEMPCLLRFDWSKPIDAESGRGKGLGRSENKQGGLETRSETRRGRLAKNSYWSKSTLYFISGRRELQKDAKLIIPVQSML